MPDPVINLNDLQQVPGSVVGVNKVGKPVTLPSAPTWISADPSIVTVKPSVDGLSATVVAVSEGKTSVSVSAVLADGSTLSKAIPATVTGSPAVGLVVTIGDPVDIVSDAPAV